MAQTSKTKKLSGWSFTVKQGTTNKDSATNKISTTRLTMPMEAVTHTLCWIASRRDNQTAHAIIHTDSVSWPQKIVTSEVGGPDFHLPIPKGSTATTVLDMLD